MKKLRKKTSAVSRCSALAISSFFLLFLSLSQPHRVHHFFESHDHPHDETRGESESHDHGGQSPAKPARTDCLVLSVTQNCQVGQVDLVQLAFVESHLELFHPEAIPWVDSFASFFFLQRAPPDQLQSTI
jgi:hypothetical protein